MVNEHCGRRMKRNKHSSVFSTPLVQFEKQMRGVYSRTIGIEQSLEQIDENLHKYHDKLRVLENMIELASQSLITYFERVRTASWPPISSQRSFVLANGECAGHHS